MLLHILLRETKLLALANMQVDLVSDVCDYGSALENVRVIVLTKTDPADGDPTAAMSSSDVDL